MENIDYKIMFHEQKEKLENQTCSSCDNLKKIIVAKEQILSSIASGLNKLSQTKDFSIIQIILKQINGDTDILTPPDNISPLKDNNQNHVIAKEVMKENNGTPFKSPKKEEPLECQDESVSEIEGTPTGRKSPILQSKIKNLSIKDKKKCPNSWPTPENKSLKLTYPSPTHSKSGGRMRQGRLNFVKIKNCSVVDLTCSPENRAEIVYNENNIQCNVKKEMIDNDETIMPSPTSAAVNFPPLYEYKSIANSSPRKFPTVAKLKIKAESSDSDAENIVKLENEKSADHSINILNQYSNRFKSPKKIVKTEDETHCDESISLLQHNKHIDTRRNNNQLNSPSKRPLAENVNIMNKQDHGNESSMSILQREPIAATLEKANDDVVKRVKTNMAPVYKEPAVRKKAEKRALLGWSCDECKNFYDELYKDDPAMLAQKMDECSKHRGRTNPVRPKTPEGFWNPRWDVPQDTEEFNRRNNAI
ncbi:uncharacterized protein LOC112057013 isoform X2 [Bicyclus anynana]|nr:uncharacterized protein LOC112057013 isoform X2 [Bicyclus anynana]